MENSVTVNGFIGSLPRMVKKKVWKVTDANGNVMQGVSASDNRKSTAQRYIDTKYPGQILTLTFSHFSGFLAIPR